MSNSHLSPSPNNGVLHQAYIKSTSYIKQTTVSTNEVVSERESHVEFGRLHVKTPFSI
jgi:hypothetical protein